MILAFIIATVVLSAAKDIWVEVPWMPLAAAFGMAFYSFVYAGRDTYISLTTWRVSLLLMFSTFFALLTDVVAHGCVLQDNFLIACDAYLGLDAREWADWMNSNRSVHRVLHIAYFSFIPQIMLSLLMSVRPVIKWLKVSGFVTLLVFALCPAMGSYSDVDALGHNQPIKERMESLSSGSVNVLRIEDCEGIICAPSFHTIVGVLMIAAFWNTRLRPWITLLNILMIVSTIPIGAHYFVDVFLGIIVATVVVKVVK